MHAILLAEIERFPVGPIDRSGMEQEPLGGPPLRLLPSQDELRAVVQLDRVARLTFGQDQMPLDAKEECRDGAAEEDQQTGVGHGESRLRRHGKRTNVAARILVASSPSKAANQRLL